MVPLPAVSSLTVPRPFLVRRVRKELADAWTLELESKDGAPRFSFAPGQFTMVYLFGVGEVPLSISGPSERLVHTVRAVGAVTRALCAVRAGAVLGIRGPYGNGWPLAACEGKDVVVVAGGMGLAPLRPVVYHLIAKRERFGKVVLLVGARTPDDLLFARELEHWRSRFDLEVRVTVDRADRSWKGDVGVVTTLIPRATFDPSKTIALACGPEVMMRFTIAELKHRGVTPDNTYLSMERNMKCAVGFCGHCQFGPTFICKDGPVFPLPRVESWLRIREV